MLKLPIVRVNRFQKSCQLQWSNHHHHHHHHIQAIVSNTTNSPSMPLRSLFLPAIKILEPVLLSVVSAFGEAVHLAGAPIRQQVQQVPSEVQRP